MTEYATDPDAIHEFLTARDRTLNWVDIHSRGLPFMSPSSPPSILSDEDTPSYGPSESDASSSHSLPPRMLLRYDDGRPDIPIPHNRSAHSASRGGPSAHKSSRHTRSRSGSLAHPAPVDIPPMPARQAQSLSYASGSRYASSNPSGQPLVTPPRSPEHIRVLPSRQPDDSQHMAAAPTQPQTVFPHQPSIHDRVPRLADPLHTSNRSVYAPTPRHAPSPSQPIPIAPSPTTQTRSHPAPGPHNGGSRFYEHPGMAASRAQSGLQTGLPYQYSPPAIVYAPSGKHGRSNYHPPAIVYSPSSHAHRRAPAPGIAYSRSDPLPHPTQYSHAGSTPFPSAHGSTSRGSRQRSHSTTEHLQGRGRSNGSGSPRDRTRTRSPTPSLSPSDTSSDSSGSTYYVLPSPGQKVQIIVPNAATVYTSTAKSSRSPRSPVSPTDSPKRPFFARIFSRGSGSVDSRGSSGQARGERERGKIPFAWR
ncbi:hypothetical protein LXA43DRAFT_243989 [Ganoderma leucocontextum]|nr:hypothetical protein LXA43DRAFT_243989 [Ganoderma leucocontextum]